MIYILTLANEKDIDYLPQLGQSLGWLDVPYKWIIGWTGNSKKPDLCKYDIPFESFSQAKNCLMNCVQEDENYNGDEWCLWIDADEVLQPGNIKMSEWLPTVSKSVAGAWLKIVSPNRNLDQEVRTIVSNNPRFFRIKYRYSGLVHENIMVEIQASGGKMIPFEPHYLGHFGYDISKQEIMEKSLRNGRFLNIMRDMDDDNSMTYMYLARQMLIVKDYRSAHKLLQRAMSCSKVEEAVKSEFIAFKRYYMIKYWEGKNV